MRGRFFAKKPAFEWISMINPCRCAEPYDLKPLVLLSVHGLHGLRWFFAHKNFLGIFWFRYAEILNTSIQTRATQSTRAELLIPTVSRCG